MNIKNIWIFVVLLATHLNVNAQEIKKEITVKAATVYLSKAKVFGETSLNLQKGINQIRIVNLPNDLIDETYKIEMKKGTTLMSIVPHNNYLDKVEPTAEEKALVEEAKKLNREKSLIEIQTSTLEGEKNLIENNLKVSESDKVTPQEQLIKLSDFYSTRMLAIDTKLFELNEKISDLQTKITDVNYKIQEFGVNKNKNNKELLLEIQSESTQNVSINISYVVNNAGWVPSYDLRAISVKEPLEIVYKGAVYQKTGQDWNNIKLHLSTYLPIYNQDRPILNPLYVSEYVSQNFDMISAKGSSDMRVYANSYQMRDKKSEEVAFDVPVTQVAESQMNILYELNYNQNIKSQDKEQYVILDKKTVQADYKYHVVPKVSNQVYLMAFVKNWQNLNLISGEASIYFDDNYIGKTSITTNYIKDDFPISLGVDERIIAKRFKIEDKTSTKTLNSNKWETETYEISIRNNTKSSIDIEILDQIPISENSKIVVKALELGDGNFDKDTGSILWNRNIASGLMAKIPFSYEIKYPKEYNLRYHH